MKQDRANNPEKYRILDHARRTRDPKTRLMYSTKQTAKHKNLEHTISRDDFELPEYCPYTGIKIGYVVGRGKKMDNPSIDRLDSTKGYIPGNVELISNLANSMKNCATKEQLQSFALEVLRRWPITVS